MTSGIVVIFRGAKLSIFAVVVVAIICCCAIFAYCGCVNSDKLANEKTDEYTKMRKELARHGTRSVLITKNGAIVNLIRNSSPDK
jgi:hypothetical protein